MCGDLIASPETEPLKLYGDMGRSSARVQVLLLRHAAASRVLLQALQDPMHRGSTAIIGWTGVESLCGGNNDTEIWL
jgi:hypothetical protein